MYRGLTWEVNSCQIMARYNCKRGVSWTRSAREGAGDITIFFPRIDRIFSDEAHSPFFGAQGEGFSEFRST